MSESNRRGTWRPDHVPVRALIQGFRTRPGIPHQRRQDRRRPCLRTADGGLGNRHASALELFFDLVFVVAVGELAAALEHDPTAGGMLRYVVLFVPVWWAWVGYTFYADRFDNDDLAYRLIMIVAMLAVSSLAVSVPEVFHGSAGSVRFVLSYAVVRLLLIVLYLRVHYYLPQARPLTVRYLAGFGTGLLFWSASLLVPAPARYGMWAAGMLCELAPPLVSSAAIAAIPFHVSHIPERFGLFTLIVLGEAVALDAMAIAPARLDLETALVAAGGFLIATALWWLYFDCVDASPLRRWQRTGQAYVYGHLVVFAAITATGVGVLLATTATRLGAEAGVEGDGGRWALCYGTAAFLLAIGVIHLINVGYPGDWKAWARIGLGATFVLLGALGDPLPPLVVIGILLAGLSTQAGLEVATHESRPGPDGLLRPASPDPRG